MAWQSSADKTSSSLMHAKGQDFYMVAIQVLYLFDRTGWHILHCTIFPDEECRVVECGLMLGNRYFPFFIAEMPIGLLVLGVRALRPLLKKIVQEVSIQISRKGRLLRSLKIALLAYIWISALVLTLMYGAFRVHLLLEDNFYSLVPPGLTVTLANGYVYGFTNGMHETGTIYMPDGKILVTGVTFFQISGQHIYGQRNLSWTASHHEYFICAVSKNCETTQNLRDIELDRALAKLGLPPFTPEDAESHKGILMNEWLKRLFTMNWRMNDLVVR